MPTPTGSTIRLGLEVLELRDVPAGLFTMQHFLATKQSAPVSVVARSTTRAIVPAPASTIALTAVQKLRADRLISTFENSTATLQYGYVENLNDGRGYTAGRAGFTTGTGDALIVVERYARLAPQSALSSLLPRLRELAAQSSDSVDGLEAYPAAWRTASADPRFRTIQDQVTSEMYYRPAVLAARALGVKNAMTLVALYDTAIQHGSGAGPDTLESIIRRTNLAVGGTPRTQVSERRWLLAFLAERERTLNNPDDPSTRDAWRASVDRVLVLRAYAQVNPSFVGPLRYVVYGDRFAIS